MTQASMIDPRYKYPRTPHLPWSAGVSVDDLVIDTYPGLENQEVVVTEKMDGENTTMYRDYIHARSVDSKHHPSRNWVKQFHGRIAYHIPPGWRFCGENLYARHSLPYHNLQSYFYLFSIWDESNCCLSWDDTEEWAVLLEIPMPRTLYRGLWAEDVIRNLVFDPQICEGYVVRTTASFAYSAFAQCVAKVVRSHHVQTDEHWMFQEVIPNQLADTVEDIGFI